MFTTPDNPYIVLPLLHSRGTALQGLLSGYYKLTGDRVSLLEVIFFLSQEICSMSFELYCMIVWTAAFNTF